MDDIQEQAESMLEEDEEQEVVEPEEDVEEVDSEEEEEVAEPQSEEENARYAKIRRKAEENANRRFKQREDSIRKEMTEELDSTIASMGLINPYTDKPVMTQKELQEYTEAVREEQSRMAEEKIEEAGLTKDEIKALVDNHPDVKQAKADRAKLAEISEKVEQEEADKLFKSELKIIQTYNPDIKNAKDFFEKVPQDEIQRLVNRGYSISDAYFSVYKDDVFNKRAELKAQETRNNISSKGHFAKSKTRGAGGTEIPQEAIDYIKELVPNATLDEIEAFYEREKKRGF